MILCLQLSHNVILQLQYMLMILTQLSHLEYAEFVDLHTTLLVINIQ